MPGDLLLYDYWRSSAAYRVRIALNLKALQVEQRSIHLVRDGGEQHQPNYSALNPQQLVPTLVHGDAVLTQSLAIIEYLEETWPQVPLLPVDRLGRSQVRALAGIIACDLHPLNNLRVLQFLVDNLDHSDSKKMNWYRHWVKTGLTAFEAMLTKFGKAGVFCHGRQPGLADCCLIPQVYNAKRFSCDLDAYPLIRQIAANCDQHEAFVQAAPEQQPDAIK